jgi:hypothetical protein
MRAVTPDGERIRDSRPRLPRVSRPQVDPWRDADDERRERGFTAETEALLPPTPEPQDLIALSRSYPSVTASARQMAVGPLIAPTRRPQAPARPIKRTMIWQGMLLLAALATIIAGIRTTTAAIPAYASAFEPKSAIQKSSKIVDLVPIQTQIDPTIGYDSPDQYNQYSGASCSAAATSSVLLAWGDPNGRIGQVIDDMGGYLSPTGGLQSPQGFAQVAKKQNFNIWMSNTISAAQVAQIVTTQGIPVVIGVRDTHGGYYRYFAPGHFLVVTGADANGFRIVDNSTYYVHYLPTADFLSLWDYPRAVVFTPPGYAWQPPN